MMMARSCVLCHSQSQINQTSIFPAASSSSENDPTDDISSSELESSSFSSRAPFDA